MKTEKIHSKFGQFVKGAVNQAGQTIGDDVFRQIYPETTDRDVLIDSGNPELGNYERLSQVLTALSKYAVRRPGIELTSKYSGYGEPTLSIGAQTGDKYVDLATGKIYELRGREDLQGGFIRVDLASRYLTTLYKGSVSATSTSSESLKTLTDDSVSSYIGLPANRKIVFDLREQKNISKIRIAFNNAAGVLGSIVISGSNDEPSSLVVGNSVGMNWTTLMTGNGNYGLDTSNTSLTDRTVDSDGSGSVEIQIKNSAYKYRYVALSFDTADDLSSVGITTIAVYETSNSDDVEFAWVCVDGTVGSSNVSERHVLSDDNVIPSAILTSETNPCTSASTRLSDSAIAAYAYAGIAGGTKIFYCAGTHITSTSPTNVFSIYTKRNNSYVRLCSDVTDYTFEESQKDITIVFRDTTDRFTKAEHLSKLSLYEIEPVIRMDDMQDILDYYLSDVVLTESFVVDKIREFITFSHSLPSTAPTGSICYMIN